MKKKRVAALVMAAILGVTGFSVPGIGVVQAEEAHTEMSGEAEQQEINLAADRGSTARASKFLAASGNLPAREPGLAFDGISDNNGEADNSRWQSGEDAEFSEQWLEVDLGGICVVSEIKVDFSLQGCTEISVWKFLIPMQKTQCGQRLRLQTCRKVQI